MKTKERLAAVLGAAGLGELSRRALLGHYDDFESPLATPIMQLVLDLEAVGAHELAKRARNGEFDSTKEEAEAWYEREGKDLLK